MDSKLPWRSGYSGSRGLTLFELMIALTIAAILVAASSPALGRWTDNKRLTSAASQLKQGLQFAREMAVMKGVATVICPTDTPDGEAQLVVSSATARCSDSPTWHTGWLIYQDTNGDRSQQSIEPLIRRGGAMQNIAARSSIYRKQLVFYPNGTAPGQTATIVLCGSRGADYALGVVLANSGRISIRQSGEAGFNPTCTNEQ